MTAEGVPTCVSITECEDSQYESLSPSPTSDRACSHYTVCSTSTQYEQVAATQTSDRVCRPITQCDLVNQYESVPATATSDASCAALSICEYGVHWMSVVPTHTSDRECTALTVCTRDQFELVPPAASLRANRQCKSLTTCSDGAEFQSTEPTGTSDRVCTPLTTCIFDEVNEVFQYEVVKPTKTSDRVCRAPPRCEWPEQFIYKAATAEEPMERRNAT